MIIIDLMIISFDTNYLIEIIDLVMFIFNFLVLLFINYVLVAAFSFYLIFIVLFIINYIRIFFFIIEFFFIIVIFTFNNNFLIE
jgi:hypothetical protein